MFLNILYKSCKILFLKRHNFGRNFDDPINVFEMECVAHLRLFDVVIEFLRVQGIGSYILFQELEKGLVLQFDYFWGFFN